MCVVYFQPLIAHERPIQHNTTHRIRDAYVKMLFQDPIYAASKDMEQNLWKTCFYRKIEEFRKRIRKYASAASSAETKCVGS